MCVLGWLHKVLWLLLLLLLALRLASLHNILGVSSRTTLIVLVVRLEAHTTSVHWVVA